MEGDRRDGLGRGREDLPEGVFDVVGGGGRVIVVVGRVGIDAERDFPEGNVFRRFDVRIRSVDGRGDARFGGRRFVKEGRALFSERLGVFFLVVGVLRFGAFRRVCGERDVDMLAERLFFERVWRRGEREARVGVRGGPYDFVKRGGKNRRFFWDRRFVEFGSFVSRRFFVGRRIVV